MRSEYLLFNLFIFALPFGFGWIKPFTFQGGRIPAFVSALLVSVPFLVWDSMVAGSHWFFSPSYTLGIYFVGLPIEEVMFFFTVPFACLYTWEKFFAPHDRVKTREPLVWVRWIWWLALPVGIWMLAIGKGYTGLTCLSLAIAAYVDRWAKTSLLLELRTYLFLLVVIGCTFIFNGYLTSRPIVTYAASQQLDFRLWTIPIEDFGFGIALLLCNLVVYQRLRGRVADPAHRSWLVRWIESRFGGYRHRVVVPDTSKPLVLETPKQVAVIGGGLAGLRAAMCLASRGFRVTILEKNEYLGGKVGSWTSVSKDGQVLPVSHGFHAFFRHYYNLNQMLDELGCTASLRGIDDYLILGDAEQRYSFKKVATTPVLNLLSLAHHGIYKLREVAFGPAGRKMEAFLRYDAEKTYAAYDQISFETFSKEAQLPPSLQLIFNSFSRAFFSDPDRMSMAALMESFHFYYLSHDHGLLYDYLDDDYEATLLAPAREYLTQHEATICLDTPVESLGWDGQSLSVNGEDFDYVVMAADVCGATRIIEAAPTLQAAFPEWCAQMQEQRGAQGYSVWRLWIDRDLPADLSPFFITDRERVLDAVAIYHRLEQSAASWVETHGGGILELHCYALPLDMGEGAAAEEAVKEAFLKELIGYFPELKGMSIVHEHLQVKRDFAAFHVGMAARRPGVDTAVPGLFLAGDWVQLPYPAMLMEAACMSGLLSANAILSAEGLQLYPVDSVPTKGILSDLPAIPGYGGT